MDANFRSFLQSTVRFFIRPNFTSIEADQIALLERQVEEAPDQQRGQIIETLSWSRIHSRKQEDIRCEIAMLKNCSGNNRRIIQEHWRLYHLAVAHYNLGDYAKSRQLAEQCLEIEPGCSEALSLLRAIEEKILIYGVLGAAITSLAAGFVVGKIAKAWVRKN